MMKMDVSQDAILLVSKRRSWFPKTKLKYTSGIIWYPRKIKEILTMVVKNCNCWTGEIWDRIIIVRCWQFPVTVAKFGEIARAFITTCTCNDSEEGICLGKVKLQKKLNPRSNRDFVMSGGPYGGGARITKPSSFSPWVMPGDFIKSKLKLQSGKNEYS